MQADKLRDNANRALRALEGEDWFSESGGSMLASNDIAVMIRDLLAIAEAAEDLRADAMRYAWLRHKLTCGHLSVSEEVAITMAKSPEQLDAAIDAALSTVVPVRDAP